MSRESPPPRLATRLLDLLATSVREAVAGDLAEAFARRREAGPGLWVPLWYWKEVLAAVLLLPWHDARAHRFAGEGLMSTLLADIRYALRQLRRAPAHSLVVVLTVALGVGAATAIFSAVYPILFAPLPYPSPERLVMAWEQEKDGERSNFGWLTFHDVIEQNRSFDALAAAGRWEPALTGSGQPERLTGEHVSWQFFRVLGVAPALGRDFSADEDTPGSDRVVILSQPLWRNRFGGDSTIIGRRMTLDGTPLTVIGVMPAGFENLLDPRAQLWTTLRYNASLPYACRSCRHLRVVGRLRAGVTAAVARRDLDAISARLVAEYPTEYPAAGMLVRSLREDTTAAVRPALLAVLAAVGLLLLIACSNVTGLLLARASQRRSEFAVRSALGAGRGRMIRQLLTESVVVAVVGGVAGIALAAVGTRALVALSPDSLPRSGAIHLSPPVLAFALFLTSAVGLLFGLVPALRAGSLDLQSRLRAGARSAVTGRRSARAVLVVGEITLAVVLLVGSGLLLRSMNQLLDVAPGFDARNLVTLQVQAGGPGFESDSAVRRYFGRVVAAVGGVPGVKRAALTSQLPLSGDFDAFGIHVEAHPAANPAEDPSGHRYAVSADYFATMGIPLLRGRGFVTADNESAPPVVAVSRETARRLWPGEEPLGQRIRVGDMQGPLRTVVGVVGDVKQVSLAAETPMAVYVPAVQWLWADNEMSLVVRVAGDATGMVPSLRRAIWSVDKDQPIVRVETMDGLIAATASERRFILMLFECFGASALLLAAAGMFGMLAGGVAERRREIGVRSALGASRALIVTMILRHGLELAVAGVVIGLGLSAVLSQSIRSLLFGVSGLDFSTYGAVALLLLGVAAAACGIPAWRASRVDPVETLRAD